LNPYILGRISPLARDRNTRMSSSNPDPETAALILQLHRELNGLTRSSRRGGSLVLEPPKRETRPRRARSVSREPTPEPSQQGPGDFEEHLQKKAKKGGQGSFSVHTNWTLLGPCHYLEIYEYEWMHPILDLHTHYKSH
jgi:hypothetical protein